MYVCIYTCTYIYIYTHLVLLRGHVDLRSARLRHRPAPAGSLDPRLTGPPLGRCVYM